MGDSSGPSSPHRFLKGHAPQREVKGKDQKQPTLRGKSANLFALQWKPLQPQGPNMPLPLTYVDASPWRCKERQEGSLVCPRNQGHSIEYYLGKVKYVLNLERG